MEASTSSEAEAPGVSDLDSYSESEDSQLSLQEDPEEVTPSVSVHNLLDRLKCPKSSDLSRKRKIRSNPPKGKKRSKGAVATGLSLDVDKLDWWKQHETELPLWSSNCKSVLLIQPSSAAAERVFSLLANSFNERQTSALEDYIQTSLMLQYIKL